MDTIDLLGLFRDLHYLLHISGHISWNIYLSWSYSSLKSAKSIQKYKNKCDLTIRKKNKSFCLLCGVSNFPSTSVLIIKLCKLLWTFSKVKEFFFVFTFKILTTICKTKKLKRKKWQMSVTLWSTDTRQPIGFWNFVFR